MGSYLLYYLVIKPLSFLPLWVLYRLSDFIYLVIYYLVRYRKVVVFKNISKSFPEKSDKEVEALAKKFYRHLCDLIIESLKYFSISEKELLKRFRLVNPEIFKKYENNKQNIMLISGHYGNWEWISGFMPYQSKHLILGAYSPIKNKFFSEKFFKSRSRFGAKLISTKEIGGAFENYKNTLNATAFLTDQTPSNPLKCYWTNFLNQDTAVLFGTEKFAVKYNYPILFGKIRKIKRGYYSVEYAVLFEEPAKTSKYEITEAHTRYLEEIIKEKPEYWLWSHKRWKHKRPTNWVA